MTTQPRFAIEQQLRNEREHNRSATVALTQSLDRVLELYNEAKAQLAQVEAERDALIRAVKV